VARIKSHNALVQTNAWWRCYGVREFTTLESSSSGKPAWENGPGKLRRGKSNISNVPEERGRSPQDRSSPPLPATRRLNPIVGLVAPSRAPRRDATAPRWTSGDSPHCADMSSNGRARALSYRFRHRSHRSAFNFNRAPHGRYEPEKLLLFFSLRASSNSLPRSYVRLERRNEF